MLKVFKSDVERLEQNAAKAEAELHKIKSSHEAAVALVGKLSNDVAQAFADSAPNADELQDLLFKAELRAGSLAKAIITVNHRYGAAKGDLAEAKAQAKREESAARLRKLADELLRLKPGAARATQAVAEAIGQIPIQAFNSMGGATPQIMKFWAPAHGFYNGDALDVAATTLRAFADEVLARTRSADLGASIDTQTESFGGKPIAKAS